MNRWKELLNNQLATGGCIIKDGKVKWYRCYNDIVKEKKMNNQQAIEKLNEFWIDKCLPKDSYKIKDIEDIIELFIKTFEENGKLKQRIKELEFGHKGLEIINNNLTKLNEEISDKWARLNDLYIKLKQEVDNFPKYKKETYNEIFTSAYSKKLNI